MDRADNADILCVPAAPQDADAILRLYARIFHQREPLLSSQSFGEDRTFAFARELLGTGYGRRSLEAGLWMKAVDEDARNALVGFVVCGDPLEQTPSGLPEGLSASEAEKALAALALLEQLREPLEERLGGGRWLHISGVGVAPGYEGRGIATRMLRMALERAGELGYTHAAAECTGPASRRCHEKCGFRSLHSVRYAEFRHMGRRPFADLEGECHLMVKDLL